MSQSTVPQWDPLEILGINEKPDGNFTCSGVKNGTTDACGYNLRGPTALAISNLLDEMSILPHQDAHQFLRDLAEASLCQHHKRQARGKVAAWAAVINRLPSSIEATPTQSTPLQGNRSPTLQESNRELQEKVRLLQEEVELLTAQISSLKMGREENASHNSAVRRKGKK